MHWKQDIDPLNNLVLSASVALIPVFFIFWALLIRRMKGYQAAGFATIIALIIAVFIYGMPFKLAILATTHGALYGLFPICWLIIAAVFLFNITVKSGQFEIIKSFMASITADRRLQALLIAFSFGSFLEGTAGFGAPVAITAAMLVGLGFNPLYAAGVCLIANTAPVAFGSIGIPITVASQVSDIPELALSQMVGRTLPFLSLLLPFYLVSLIAGFRKATEILPAILVSGISFALLQWFSSNFIGPALPDVLAGIGSLLCLIVLLKWWKPKSLWQFPGEELPAPVTAAAYNTTQKLRAWAPFMLLTIMIIAWGLQPIKDVLNALGYSQFEIAGLHHSIVDKNENPLPYIFRFNYLSAAGTAIMIAAVVSIPVVGLRFGEGGKIFLSTLDQLKIPIITIALVLAFAYLLNASGITITMAEALSNTGYMFPFFSPMLGWLGVFITGSDTSANALFGKLQGETATAIGIDPVVTVAANVSGGVVGKMISPQSIAVAAAAGQLVGKESDLFRFTVKHSFYMLLMICCLVYAQAYLFQWIIPVYNVNSVQVVTSVDPQLGYWYLVILGGILVLFLAAGFITRAKHLFNGARHQSDTNIQNKQAR